MKKQLALSACLCTLRTASTLGIKTNFSNSVVRRNRFVFFVSVLLCSSSSIASPSKVLNTRHLIDTVYPGVGYLNNTSTVGIWGNNSGVNNPILVLTPDQNVGIGVVNPLAGYKLSVNGNAIFTRIKVKEYGQWADYVFKRGYKLMPIDSLENYIKKHHHLPEVPSAKEVEKNHLDIGEHQALLLKKVEELTLYIIEQNKKLDEQAKRIEALEKRAFKK